MYSELPNGWYSAFWELGPLPCGFFEKIFTTTCAFRGKNNPQMKKSDEIENQKVLFISLCFVLTRNVTSRNGEKRFPEPSLPLLNP